MSKFLRPTYMILISALVLLTVFYHWYRGDMTPMTSAEQAYYLEALGKQTGEAARFLNPEEARAFMASDDGRSFYVLNLFRFNTVVSAEKDGSETLSGEAVFNRFASKVLPIWLAHGVHPVFSSSLERKGYSEWDFVSVVRYRSRRDFYKIQTSEAFLSALPDRLSAAQTNFRVKISGNHIPVPIALLMLIFVLLAGVLVQAVARIRTPRLQHAPMKSGVP